MSHLLDVARIAYIRNLEKGYGFRKDVIYAAAVLHDIGKALQYEEKFPMRLRESGSPGKYWIHFRKKRDFLRKKKER